MAAASFFNRSLNSFVFVALKVARSLLKLLSEFTAYPSLQLGTAMDTTASQLKSLNEYGRRFGADGREDDDGDDGGGGGAGGSGGKASRRASSAPAAATNTHIPLPSPNSRSPHVTATSNTIRLKHPNPAQPNVCDIHPLTIPAPNSMIRTIRRMIITIIADRPRSYGP